MSSCSSWTQTTLLRSTTGSQPVFLDTLCFKYVNMPAGKQIYVRALHNNIIGNLSISQYVHINQGNTPVVRTKYVEVQDLDLVSHRILHTVIKVGTNWIPIVAHIIPGIRIPLLIGMNYKDSHAKDPDTQCKVNALNTKKIFFL